MPELHLKESLASLKNLKKINIRFRKREKKLPIPPPTPKPTPKGFKVVDKCPLYEPFSHVATVQNPETGEHKYILDELQLGPLERSVYNRVLEILLAGEEVGPVATFKEA
jgi:hypothetical protein